MGTYKKGKTWDLDEKSVVWAIKVIRSNREFKPYLRDSRLGNDIYVEKSTSSGKGSYRFISVDFTNVAGDADLYTSKARADNAIEKLKTAHRVKDGGVVFEAVPLQVVKLWQFSFKVESDSANYKYYDDQAELDEKEQGDVEFYVTDDSYVFEKGSPVEWPRGVYTTKEEAIKAGSEMFEKLVKVAKRLIAKES